MSERRVPGLQPGLVIRSMHPADLAFAAECTANESWVSENQVTLEGHYLYDPQGCIIAEFDGQAAGICVATSYGDCGFVGELIVRPQARGQGIGVALLNHAVAYLQSRGAITVYLDGVVKAVALYERNGFRKLCRSLRFSGMLSGHPHRSVRPMASDDLPAVCALDRTAFGADRSFFLARRLKLFPEVCKVMFEDEKLAGFIAGRRGGGWAAAGPWVIEEGASHPLYLLESLAYEAPGSTISIGVLESNQAAVELVRSLGFEERPDSPWRMALGPSDHLGASSQCLAVGTAAKG